MPTGGSRSLTLKRLDTPTLAERNERSTPGELLRAARERRGLALEQVAADTKIPLRHLQALERDNLAMLPGAFYGRAEVRTYARAVHLDQNLVLAALERATHAEADGAQPLSSPTPSPTSRWYLPIVIGVVATSLALGFALLERDTAGQAQQENSPASPLQRFGQESSLAHQSGPGLLSAASEPPTSQQPAPVRQPTSDAPVETAPESEEQGGAVSTTGETGLLVTSEPAGARVTVDGIGRGETPVTIRHLTPGARRIRVSKEGYYSEERLTRIATARSATLHISMRSAP